MAQQVGEFETDEEYRARIANAYGQWGAFLTEVIESEGSALDQCGESIGVKRERRRKHGATS